jgi:FAD/FMN-containing dehydrogenase
MTRAFEAAAAAKRDVRGPSLSRETLRDCEGYESSAEIARPGSVDEVADVLAWASRTNRKVTIRGQGQSYVAESLGDDIMLATDRLAGIRALSPERVTVLGGTTWRALLEALDAPTFPPVVPSWIESSIGGTLASDTGGIGKGSLKHGVVVDHVESLLVVTGDGRQVACSDKQARWLFDAVLAGLGRFGVIAEATLRLSERTPFVVRSMREVALDALAEALSDPALEHASAEALDNGRFRVFLTHPAARDASGGLTIAEHLVPPPPAVEAPRATIWTLLRREGLASFLKHHEHRVGEVLRIHPVLGRSGRAGLMRPRARVLDHEVGFFVQKSTPSTRRANATTRVSWEKICGRAADARRAKALADPHDILGSSRLIIEA